MTTTGGRVREDTVRQPQHARGRRRRRGAGGRVSRREGLYRRL